MGMERKERNVVLKADDIQFMIFEIKFQKHAADIWVA